jgi:hypothetical protein
MDSVVRLSFGVRGSRKFVRLNIGRSGSRLLKLHAAAFLDDRKIVDTAESEEAKSIKREHLPLPKQTNISDRNEAICFSISMSISYTGLWIALHTV